MLFCITQCIADSCKFLVGCLSTIYIISVLHLSQISAMYSYLDKKCGNIMMLYCPSSAASV